MSRLFKRHTGNKVTDTAIEWLPRPLLRLLKLDRKRVIMPADAREEGMITSRHIPAATLPGEGREPLKTGILNAEAEKIAAAAADGMLEVQAAKGKDAHLRRQLAQAQKEKSHLQSRAEKTAAELDEAEEEYANAREKHRLLLGRYHLSRWGYRAFLAFAAVADLCIAAFAWAFFSANIIEQGILSLGVIAVLIVMAHKLGLLQSGSEPDDAAGSDAANDKILKAMNHDPRVVIGGAAVIILFTGAMRAVSMAKTLHLGAGYVPLMGLGFIAINFGITYAAAVLSRYAHDRVLEEARNRFKEAKARLQAASPAHEAIRERILVQDKRIAMLENSRQSNYEYHRARIQRIFYITELHIMAFRSGYNLEAGLPLHTVETAISGRLMEYRDKLIDETRPRAIVSAAAAGADDGESRLHVMAPDGDEPGDEPFEGEGTTTLTIPATTVSNR